MLQMSYIRDHQDQVIERLGIRNFTQIGLVEEVISLDENRRKVQAEADALQAEANSAAKMIGELMREGKKEEAEKVKSRSSEFKENIKLLQDKLSEIERGLYERLV